VETTASASTQTARLHAVTQALLERHGIVTREGVNAEDLPGGFSSIYPVLKAMEDAGRVRRGYFVEGLGAAQFGYPGAVERLRAERDTPDDPATTILAACDPGQPYGAAIPWPRRDDDDRRSLARATAAQVVLVDGVPVLYVERSGRGIVTLPAAEQDGLLELAIPALLGYAARHGAKGLTIERIDGGPATESPLAANLRAVGFATGYRGLTYRPARLQGLGRA
jgi:ATP-dependent Lhr-like helicase